MASRNFAQVAPTAATIALNAYIYGYGGHSLVTPHAALKRFWWTDERIESKVTRSFVLSKLRGEERGFLDRPLAFGEGLTDDTYMEWILGRAKRLFLILSEIGVPDQIFGCIDDSWDDNDLPIPLEHVKSLELSYDNDEALNKRFYNMQFVYLLRELKRSSHVDYGPKEHIPMDHVNTIPPAVCLQQYDRVHFPARPDEVFMRRKFSLTDKETGNYHGETFIRDMQTGMTLAHEHIASVWATYTSEDAGFAISDFVAEHTLGTFIEHRTPMQLLRVPPSERPVLLMQWLHCLSDALASLHHRGVAHTQIRPSNLWIDKSNRIAFADVGAVYTLQRNKKAPKTEAYDYAAPEQQITQSPVLVKSSSPPVSSMNAFNRFRKMSVISMSDSSSSGSSSGGNSTRSNSFCSTPIITGPLPSLAVSGRTSSMSTIRTALSPTPTIDPQLSMSARNFSRHLPTACSSPPPPPGPRSPSSSTSSGAMLLPMPSLTIDPDTLRDLPICTPAMSDIYSLACIFLDILTFMLKGKNSEFIKFRSTRHQYATGKAFPSSPSPSFSPGNASHGNANKSTAAPKFRTDTSFHFDPDKIAAWIQILEEDSYRHSDPIFRTVPQILRLIRLMLVQNAHLRPTALEVRNRLQEILLAPESGVATLCCAGREWPEMKTPTTQPWSRTVHGGNASSSSSSSPFRRDKSTKAPAEEQVAENSIRPGTGAGVLRPMSHDSKAASARCSISYGDRNQGQETDQASVRSATTAAKKSRRRSSASTTVGKLGSWRNKLWRSGAET